MASVEEFEELQRRLHESEQGRQREREEREEVQRQLHKSEQQLHKSEQARQQEREEREEVQRQLHKSEQQLHESEQARQQTTFDEFLKAGHYSVFSRFTVEQDKELTSKGSITNPKNKYCPTLLTPWPNFLKQQEGIFNVIYKHLPVNARRFDSRDVLTNRGSKMQAIADEKSLETWVHASVEIPVREIVQEFRQVEDMCGAFDMGKGVVFENHPHAMTAEESSKLLSTSSSTNPSTPPQPPTNRQDLRKLRPDQICIYRSDDGMTRTMIYVCEYKAPHKLTAPHLRAGLRKMDIFKEVVNRKTIPRLNDTGRSQYDAERLTASALTQTYHYMIEGGLDYGLLTTGEATVFLKIDWTQPDVLYYHLAEPRAEVAAAHPEHIQPCTAVGQCLAFTLMALGGPGQQGQHSQSERDKAMSNLKTWAEDFEATVRTIPEEISPDTSSS